MKRRLFLGGLLASSTAPAIVRASSLMPIWVPRPLAEPWEFPFLDFLDTAGGFHLIEAHHRRLIDQIELACRPPIVLGVDLGRPGGDFTVMTLRDQNGFLSFHHERVDPWR